MSFLTQLDWRWATKAFDPAKPVSDNDLKTILHAIRMAPSSYGLQSFRVYIVKTQAIKEEISKAAFNQVQPVQAPVLLVFCSDAQVNERTEAYIKRSIEEHPEKEESLKNYPNAVNAILGPYNEEQRMWWAAKQSYIALGFAIAACAELKIDSCPMEGFNPDEVDRILELPKHLHAQALFAIGYRSKEPSVPKFRFSDDELFVRK